jgi:hypothetical protein
MHGKFILSIKKLTDLCKMQYKKNKKTQALYQEIIIAAFSILMVSFALFIASKAVISTNEDINKASPQISYQYPAVFVHTFLMMEIKKEDIKDLNLDENKKYYVKDLLILDEEKYVNKAKEYETKYLELVTKEINNKNPLEFYKEFSKDKDVKEDNLILIETGGSTVPSLDAAIKNKNYFFYIRTINNKYTTIYFKAVSTNSYYNPTYEEEKYTEIINSEAP